MQWRVHAFASCMLRANLCMRLAWSSSRMIEAFRALLRKGWIVLHYYFCAQPTDLKIYLRCAGIFVLVLAKNNNPAQLGR